MYQGKPYPSEHGYLEQNFQNQEGQYQQGQNHGGGEQRPMMQGDQMNPNMKMNQRDFGGQGQDMQGMMRSGNKSRGYSQQGQSGQGDYNQGGNQNSTSVSDEQDQSAREAEQQKREEAMVKRQAAQMAKMLQQALTSINKRVAKLQSQGLPLTSDCRDTIAVFTDAAAKAKSATTMDELYDVQDAMQSMSDLNDCRMVIERLMSTPRILKRAGATLKSLKKRGSDVSEAETLFNELSNQFNQIKSGNPSNDDVQSFFDSAQELGGLMESVMNKKQSDGENSGPLQSSNVLDSVKHWFGF